MKLRTLASATILLAIAHVSSAVPITLGGPSSFHGFFSSPPASNTISFSPDNPSAPTPSGVRGQPGVYNVLPGYVYTIVQDIDGMPTPVTRFQVNGDGSVTYLPLL